MLCLRIIPAILTCLLLILGVSPVALTDETDREDPTASFDWYAPQSWQTLDGKPVEDNWEFSSGEIRLSHPRGGSGSIVSPSLPPNFELTWQWQIDSKTNSGVKYRVRKFGPHMFSNKYLGVEYQIIDDAPDSFSSGSTAAIYDLIAPLQKPKTLHAPGQWNAARIVANGNKLEHYLNGQLVTAFECSGPKWDRALALSKFYGADGFALPDEENRLMLTDHGGAVAFKDFHFVALPESEPSVQESLQGPFLANGIRNSWADQHSIVVWTRTTAAEEFLAEGKPFLVPQGAALKQLLESSDETELTAAQLPAEATLDDMLGACPGAPGQVKLTYFPGKQRNAKRETAWTNTERAHDCTAQWKLTDLKPDTQYAVVVEVRPGPGQAITDVLRGAFRTAPAAAQAEDIEFCFTTCHDFLRRDDGLRGHKIYSAMLAMQPDFVVHAGDIEYYDKPEPYALTRELMRFKWGRIFALPNNRQFYSTTTSYFIKDDHDTLKNDCWAGQRYGAVSFEEGVRIFNEEQFPSRTPRYMTVNWGKHLQIWFLEGRDYRSPNNMPDGPEKTILGQAQKRWLFETLAASTATFKLVCSPTPIVGPDRKNKKDNHANTVFAVEGEEIRSEFSKHKNVFVLCGDRHWQYASLDAESNLWEFGCGPGSEKHQLGWKPGDKRPVHQFLRVKGGFLSGKLKNAPAETGPQLTIRHHSVDGQAVSEFVFGTGGLIDQP